MPKNGNGRRKSKNGNGEEDEAAALQQMIEELHIRQRIEEERQEKFDEEWKRKLEEDEQCEDLKASCAPDCYFPAPRAQSNIWLQVSHEAKNTQRVQLSFMNTFIPKPDPPLLPRLPLAERMKLPPKVEEPKEEENNNKKKK